MAENNPPDNITGKAAGATAVGGVGAAATVAGGFYMLFMQFLSMILAIVQSIVGAIIAVIAVIVGIIAAILSIFMIEIDTCAPALANSEQIKEISEDAGGTVQQTAVAQRIWFLLGQDTGSPTASGGMPDMSVAALLGNVENESGFNASSVNSLGCKGLFQWCFGRMNSMVAFAETNNGGVWQDVDLQVQYVLKENHKGAPELQKPGDHGLDDVDAISDYWGRHWEVFSTDLNDPEFAERRAASQRWNAAIPAWRNTSGTGAAKLGDYDAAAAISNALEAGLAAGDTGATEEVEIAAKNAAGRCGTKTVNAEGNAKAAELAVLLTDGHTRVGENVSTNGTDGSTMLDEWPNYEKAHGIAIPGDTLYASCDRFVATVVRLSLDKAFPPGGYATAMGVWMSDNDNWEEITDPAASQPGDVWVKSGCPGEVCQDGHIMMYVGTQGDLPNVIADASYYDRMPALQPNSYTYYAGMSNVFIYRYKGPGDPLESEFVK
ncbi:MAG: phage tail-type lysozyme domain-containing protein [Bifidobacteriaceae bacterium]|jgi:hypothetical protein|nr:phage tail-type lysozyme domain-containing protein [Bifidobacteriaceae bacterium]